MTKQDRDAHAVKIATKARKPKAAPLVPHTVEAKAALRKDISWLLGKVENAFHNGTEVTLTRRDLQRVSGTIRRVQDEAAVALGY